MEDFGVTINFTMVTNSDGVTIGINYNDSNGGEFSKEQGVSTIEEALDLFTSADFLAELSTAAIQSQETPEERIARLEAELESSNIDNAILEKRLSDLIHTKDNFQINNNHQINDCFRGNNLWELEKYLQGRIVTC